MRSILLGSLCLVCSCGSSTTGSDQGVGDLASAADSSAPRDLSQPGDAPLSDLSALPDFSSLGDLLKPQDMSHIADLTLSPCDGGGGQAGNATVNCSVNGAACQGADSVCCRQSPFGAGTCVTGCGPCGSFLWFCDNSSDCARMGDICCVTASGSTCTTQANCTNMNGTIGCQQLADCPAQMNCCGVGPTPNYHCINGPCPISRRKYKEDIHYLDQTEIQRLHQSLVDYPLTTWRYKQDPSHDLHLGFIIDDVAPSPAVAPGGETVDLYGYTTMAVAAIKEQARQIAELRAEVRALHDELANRGHAKRHR